MKIGVLGSGIIGLWTAYELSTKGHEVTVYSNAPATATTSASAVAVITPLFPWSLEENPELFETSLVWFRQTLLKFHELNVGNDFMNIVPSFEFGYLDELGVQILEKGFPASRLAQLNFSKTEILPMNQAVTVENELNEPQHVTFAVNFDAEMVDTQVFLPFFVELLKSRGVQFSFFDAVKVEDIDQLPESILFNCLGIFSQFLFPDVGTEMYPIRGQSHFIECTNEPPYHGIASGHHAVFKHKRGYYLGSYFLDKGNDTWADEKQKSALSLVTLPTEDEMKLTVKFATETYVELAKQMGIDAEPLSIDSILRVNTGVRPFRKEGPVMGSRKISTKTVYDNFAHGAHGWTIGYGSTVDAIKIFESEIGDG